MMLISDHITYKEAIRSITAIRNGISNEPNKDQVERMQELAIRVFEPLRLGLGEYPINIASFFRSEDLNDRIGGAKNSQHCANNGAAIDLDNDDFAYPSNQEIFDYIRNNLDFDQLINEFNYSWVHVSWNRVKNRSQVLKAIKVGKLTRYIEI